MRKQYMLKNRDLRAKINLHLYREFIENAVHKVMGDSVKVEVFKDHYELDKEPSSVQARIIGLNISKNCSDLRKCRKTYIEKNSKTGKKSKSRQIFIGKVE